MAIVEMAFAKKAKGRMGNVIFYTRLGKTIMRCQSFNPKNPKTPAQQKQRLKFKLVQSLDCYLRTFIRMGFPEQADKITQYNSFMKANLKTAVKGDYPNMEVDFSNLVVSQGSLYGAEGCSLNGFKKDAVIIEWLDNSGKNNARATDRAMALIINPERGSIAMDVNKCTRADKRLQIDVPLWEGEEVHVYLTFTTASRKRIANSKFLGTLKISGQDSIIENSKQDLIDKSKTDKKEYQISPVYLNKSKEFSGVTNIDKSNEASSTMKVCYVYKETELLNARESLREKKKKTMPYADFTLKFEVSTTSINTAREPEAIIISAEEDGNKEKSICDNKERKYLNSRTRKKLNKKPEKLTNRKLKHGFKCVPMRPLKSNRFSMMEGKNRVENSNAKFPLRSVAKADHYQTLIYQKYSFTEADFLADTS